MRILLLLIFISVVPRVLSQGILSSVYLDPGINIKLHTFNQRHFVPLTTPYFQIKPYNPIIPIGFNIGMNVGVKFKNGDKAEFGIFQDESLSGIKLSGMEAVSFTPSPVYGQARTNDFGGVAAKNINLVYKKNLTELFSSDKTKYHIVTTHLNLGISYLYKPNNGLENLTGTHVYSFIAPDSSRVTSETSHWVFPLPFINSFRYHGGIDFTIGKNGKEWFALNISYIANFSKSNNFSFTSTTIKVEKGNNKSTYIYYVTSRANGVYFTLSKRIYPIKLRNEARERKARKFREQQS